MLNNSKKYINEKVVESFRRFQKEKFGERYSEYRNKWEENTTIKNLPNFPLYINVESTFLCNLKCPTCLHGKYTIDKKKETTNYLKKNVNSLIMPDEIFEKIIKESEKNNLPSIGLNWVGEPLIVENIVDRIKMCSEAGIMDIIMSTNGVFLTEKKAEEIIDSGLTHLLFSIDATNDETYNVVRPGGDYDTVIENIKTLNRLKKEKNSIIPITRISFVTSTLNQHQIEDVVEKYSELVDFVEVQGIATLYREILPLVPDNMERVEFSCDEPFKKLTVGIDGNIYPCCNINTRGELILGNIKKETLKEAFNGPIICQIRADIEKDEYTNSQCQLCQENFFSLKT